MLLRIDEASPLPLYEQLAAAVRAAIVAGTARPGDRLPSGRDLANANNITLETVQRAYRLLADEGIVTSRVGRGTSIAPDVDPSRFAIDAEIDALVAKARAVGLSRVDVERRLRAAWP
ncbi:MAG: GntR family transcriptional regulator [Acidimicrobiales bacterium]